MKSLLMALAKLVLNVTGWKAIYPPKDLKRAVIIAVPHTSSWDGFWAICYIIASEVPMRFAIKSETFFPPLSWILRALNTIPIDRQKKYKEAKHKSSIRHIVELFSNDLPIFFILSPEGTRKKVKRWRSGFYKIAQQADVPIILSFMDYRRKIIDSSKIFHPTGNYEEDLSRIQAFYRDEVGPVGKNPEQGI